LVLRATGRTKEFAERSDHLFPRSNADSFTKTEKNLNYCGRFAPAVASSQPKDRIGKSGAVAVEINLSR
jgi:hypothetical protein